MRVGGPDRWERRRALSQRRDERVAALLTEAQRPQYDGILLDYAAELDKLDQERKQAFEQAVERTKQILTPEQARKYAELLEERRKRGSGDRRGPPWDRRRPPPEGTEQPADERATPRGGE